MKSLSVKEISSLVSAEHEIIGNSDAAISTFKPFDEADSSALVWCRLGDKSITDKVNATASRVIICDRPAVKDFDIGDKTVIITDEPRFAFMEVLQHATQKKIGWSVDPTSVIHPNATINEEVYIGPHCTIGNVIIGKGTVIHGNVFIYDGVKIGKDVLIEAGVVVGAPGFGLERNMQGEWVRFPHIGDVVIGDRVELCANCTVDRGALSSTVIGRGTKVSKAAHISHNCRIGEDCIIAGGAMISGSVTIGNNAWVGPNATLNNKITIGQNVTIAVGAVVSQDVEEGYTAVGTRVVPVDMMNILKKGS